MNDELEIEFNHLITHFHLNVDKTHCMELVFKVKLPYVLVSELDGGILLEWRNGIDHDMAHVFSNRVHVFSERTLLEKYRDYVTGEDAEKYKVRDETFIYLETWAEIIDHVSNLLNRKVQ